MKVLHLTLYLDIGGLERMVLLLCRGQKRAGWQPSVFVYERETGELLPQFEEAGVPVTFWPKGRGFSVRLLFRLRRHLRENGITLLHSHDLGALIYASLVRVLSRGEVRVIHTQHSFQHLQGWKYFLYERVFPWLASRLVCVSEDLRRTYLQLGQPFERLRLVPNGVDFRDPPSPALRNATRRLLLQAHSLPAELADRTWIVTLGRLAKVKGPQNALAMWHALPLELRQNKAALFLVGPDTDRELVRSLKLEAGPGVHFPGRTLDPASWLDAADLFLSASEFEGLPLAGLEAIAADLPMLLSNIPGHALFRGWAAFFPLATPGTGADLLERFLRGEGLGPETGNPDVRRSLELNCGAARMTERYLQLYRELDTAGHS